jgi:hypothetical protein
MKKTNVALIALLTIFALSGCSNENLESDDSGELKITASIDVTVNALSTRAAVSGFSSTPIGIFVDDADQSTPTTAYTPTANTTATVTTGSPGSGTITSAIYLNATSAKVYAYYAGGSVVGDVPTLTSPTYASKVPVTILASDAFNATGQTDYMWSTPASVSKSSTSAALTFNHALSKVIFSITPTNYAGTGSLTSISLSDGASSDYVFLTGTTTAEGMAVSNGALTGLTKTQTLTYTGTGSLTNGSATSVYALVAPTSLSSATITLSVTIDNKVYTATLPTTTVTAWQYKLYYQ